MSDKRGIRKSDLRHRLSLRGQGVLAPAAYQNQKRQKIKNQVLLESPAAPAIGRPAFAPAPESTGLAAGPPNFSIDIQAAQCYFNARKILPRFSLLICVLWPRRTTWPHGPIPALAGGLNVALRSLARHKRRLAPTRPPCATASSRTDNPVRIVTLSGGRLWRGASSALLFAVRIFLRKTFAHWAAKSFVTSGSLAMQTTHSPLE